MKIFAAQPLVRHKVQNAEHCVVVDYMACSQETTVGFATRAVSIPKKESCFSSIRNPNVRWPVQVIVSGFSR